MPKERRDRSDRENDRECRTHRSSSHRHHNESRKHDNERRDERRHRRHHHRHRTHHRETESWPSTHIYFNGSADNLPSVSLHTDHVTLASNLNSLNDSMDAILENCCELLGRLRNNPIVHPRDSQQSTSSGQRGVNHFNLASVPISHKSIEENSKPSFSGILETYKTVSVVPTNETKAKLHQSLVSHTEAKLDAIDISLICPLTRSRMSTPVRGRNCTHISCFDGEAYLQLMWDKRVEKWKCPICKILAPLSELVIDGFIMGILESVPEDVKSVEFTPDGYWRIKEGSGSFLSISKSSDNCNSDKGNNTVIDLTFDTPEKIAQKKVSNDSDRGDRNPQIQVVDLTLSP